VVDARGFVLAPGFIDMHTHSDVSLLLDGRGQSKLHQGVTTEVIGNCSFSAFPIARERRPLHRDHLARIGDDPIDPDWTDMDGYAQRLESQGTALNVAPLVGHGTLRVAAMGIEDRPPTDAELATMERLAAVAIEQGAFGLSTGLTHVPSSYGSASEVEALARVVQRHGGIYATHARMRAGGSDAAVDEAIAVGRATGIAVQYSHLALNEPSTWGQAEAMLGRFERANASGVDIRFDVYPYDASSSSLTQYLPDWLQAGGTDAMRARLRDPAVRRRALADLRAGWYGGIPWRWERVLVTRTGPGDEEAIGRTFQELGEAASRDPAELVLDLCERHGNEAEVVLFYRTEADMLHFLRHPLAMVGSDGSAIPFDQGGDRPHPRHFGTFPRILGRYVREGGQLTLEDAIHKMTAAVADRLGLHDRGRIAEGAVADLVLFDPARVIDRATFQDPCRSPVGIGYVIVAGTFVLDGGVETGARPGRVLRRGRSTM
jgi:N-acyl-D-amino-acid deacylase